MPKSKPAVELNCSEWTFLSDVACTLQVRRGICSIWFGDTAPDNSIDAGVDGKQIKADSNNSELSYGKDATAWGRASKTTKTARVSITEH